MTPPTGPCLACTVPLPRGFRQADFLAFHARDPRSLSEQVGLDSLDKGMMWQGQPARIALRFAEGSARLQVHMDAPPWNAPEFPGWVQRFLGLDQPVKQFEAAWDGHPVLGPLIAACPGLRIPQAATPFEALSWAITGQQISLAAAITLRSRLIQACGRSSGNLACFPDATSLIGLSATRLTDAGFSRRKAETLRETSARVLDGDLPLDDWWATGAQPDMIRERLLTIPGIGPWTADYTLLRGFGHADASLHGDVAVRRGLQTSLGLIEKPAPAQTEDWLRAFAPWRAFVAAHLWRL